MKHFILIFLLLLCSVGFSAPPATVYVVCLVRNPYIVVTDVEDNQAILGCYDFCAMKFTDETSAQMFISTLDVKAGFFGTRPKQR